MDQRQSQVGLRSLAHEYTVEGNMQRPTSPDLLLALNHREADTRGMASVVSDQVVERKLGHCWQ